MGCLVLLAACRGRGQQFAPGSLESAGSATESTDAGAGSPQPLPPRAGSGAIRGLVRDSDNIAIAGATVTLTASDGSPLTADSNPDGAFEFVSVPPGAYKLSVVLSGFRPWTSSGVVGPGESLEVQPIALVVLPVNSSVEVVATSHDVAEAQLGFEEKQRVLGVFPNFYTSYVWNADPLTAKQKFSLAWRFSGDPVFLGTTGLLAGVEQWQHDFQGYGQGAAGYGKRFGATYADGFASTMIGQAVLPVVFRQDPRYFVKGTGSVPSRAMYAIATSTVVCRGDNGRWQVNYSNILGNVVSAGLANLYYPASSRQGTGLTVETSLLSTALGAIGGLFQEFVLHRMTPNIPDYQAAAAGQ